jgi:nucleobase:cation symporter-1, NCS1 family
VQWWLLPQPKLHKIGMSLGRVGPVTGAEARGEWPGQRRAPFGLGGRTGTWAFANLGVVVALVIGFAGWLIAGRRNVRSQEAPAADVTAGVASG